MSITRGPLQCIATRLIISPPPTTLGESTAVLKRLQSFGHVASFTASARHEMPGTHEQREMEMTVLFSSSETMAKAQSASPFTVRVNHHLPDPRVEDPYNVRNLQSRKQPQPKTMVCRLECDHAEFPAGQNVLSAGFSPSIQTRLYQSLTNLRPPEGMTAALGVFHNDSSSIKPTPELVDRVPDLTEMYLSRPADISTPGSGFPAPTKSAND